MKPTKTIITISLVLTVLLGGCKVVDEPITIGVFPTPEPVVAAGQSDESMQRRFIDPAESSGSAVDTAVMWANRYDELSKKTEKLREENQKYALENVGLKQKVSRLETELAQAQTELDEANIFLGQMQVELVKWKSDVLGFRDEMRKAQSVQLQALTRIMKILGAEMTGPAQPLEQEDE